VVALQWAVQHLAQPFVANFVQAFAFMQCAHVVVYVFSLADKSSLILETVFRSVKGKVFSF